MTTIQVTIPDELAKKLMPAYANTPQFDKFLVNAIQAWLKTQPDPPTKQSAWEILSQVEGGQLFESADEIDGFLQNERESWE